jgi:4-alpha-glucanotransferase
MYGVQTSYEDVNGKAQKATPDTLFLTLRALGAQLEKPADATDAVRARAASLDADGIEPVLVAWGGRVASIPVRLSAASAARPVRCTLRLEDGSGRTSVIEAEPLRRRSARPGAVTHRLRIGGRALPLGYHDIELETVGGTYTARLFAPPGAAHLPAGDSRDWGLFIPLYALRGDHDAGVGTYTDLESLARWTAARGGAYVATLPLLATFLDVPFEPSPYAPVSRLFWNDLYIDTRRAPGGTAPGPPPHAAVDALHVDYRAVGADHTRALRAAAETYFAGGDTTELDRYVESHERVRDYARFRAVIDRRREPWHSWPERLRNGSIEPGDFAPEDEQFHLYSQWVADEQLGAIGRAADRDCAALYLDLPLGVHPDGYDAWRERSLFASAASAGAPPDALFTGGQDWGFRPPDPAAQRLSGHRYFIECLRHHLRHARMLRLDHVMSLYRLYWIPAGVDARSGAYVRYPAEELFAALALESHRHNAAIVGEDLGTVPREVRMLMDRRRVMRMFVLQYELSPDSENTIAEVPRDVVASVNTHDMPTLTGYTHGSDLEDQLDLRLVDGEGYAAAVRAREALVTRLRSRLRAAEDPRDLLRKVLTFLADSPARTVLINLEDLWLEPAPQNVPGTSTERENWRRRSQRTLQDIMADRFILDTLAHIDRGRQAGRAGAPEGMQS